VYPRKSHIDQEATNAPTPNEIFALPCPVRGLFEIAWIRRKITSRPIRAGSLGKVMKWNNTIGSAPNENHSQNLTCFR
jgi:hypothetical protein